MQTLRFIGFLIFVGLGCKSNEQFIIPKQISVQPQAKIISLDQVFRKVKVLTLQGETGLFSIYRMMPYQGGFLFTDTKKERVYISDARGKVSLFMDQKGEGPGEYRSIWDLKIHPNGEDFAILDRGLAKVLIYDSKGNSVKELSMKRRLMSSINSFDFLDSESLVFFTSGSPGVKFLVLNLSTESLELKVPIENELDGLAFGNDRSMTFVNDRISVIYPLSRKIERYTTDFSREEDVFLDFDRYQISEDEIKEIANDQNRMFELIQNDVNKKAHSFSLVESPNFYFTSYYVGSFQNGEYLHTIIKKRDGENLTYKAVAIDGVKVDLVLVGRNQGDEMIYSLNPEQIEMMNSENISILSNAFKIDVKPEKPILIFGTPR
ncbi:6-bladed beta-propeller [Algoriphagus algorifonticola]|uniref:6-bladed beta-propeller n=1 Tax=Algoriphagus algorifonticola TaxID=2593007 RepID=UPI0011AB10FE|nr:6-bladed beta-propeller [Algoriphagus algorifonticola]